MNLSGVGIGSDQLQDLPPGEEDLLDLGAGEISVDGMGDGRRTLQSQVIQIHGGNGSMRCSEKNELNPHYFGGRAKLYQNGSENNKLSMHEWRSDRKWACWRLCAPGEIDAGSGGAWVLGGLRGLGGLEVWGYCTKGRRLEMALRP